MFFFFFNINNIFNKFASARLQSAFNKFFFCFVNLHQLKIKFFLYDSVVTYQIIRINAFPKHFFK